MIRPLSARDVEFNKEPSEKVQCNGARVINGKAEFWIVIECGEPELEIGDARIIRDFMIDLVKAMEETGPSSPGKEEEQDTSKEPIEYLPLTRLGGAGYKDVRKCETLEEALKKHDKFDPVAIERIWRKSHPTEESNPVKRKKEAAVENNDPKPCLDTKGQSLFVGAMVIQAIPYEKTIRKGNGSILKISVSGLCRVGPPINKSIPGYCLQLYKKEEQPIEKTPSPSETQAPGPALGEIKLPDELRPEEERKAFAKGDRVKQIAGHPPLLTGPGEIISIRANGDFIVEFYQEKKILKREEIAFYHPSMKSLQEKGEA